MADAFAACGLDPDHGAVVVSQRPDLCQFQCNGAFALAKSMRRNPRELAQEILDKVDRNGMISELSIAGPGFININLDDSWLATALRELAAEERLGCPYAEPRQKVILDFGGPNVAKLMHVGHLRSTIIGDSLQRIFRFVGHEVLSDVHHGDWGTQMGMVITEIQGRWPDLPFFDPTWDSAYPDELPFSNSDLEEIYPAAATRCKSNDAEMEAARRATQQLQGGLPGYRALWERIVALSTGHMRESFAELGVTFDLWLGESHYHDQLEDMIGDLVDRGIAVSDAGAVVIKLDSEEIPPLLLEKTGGGFLYGTTDLATIRERTLKYTAQAILYVVDKRQGLHFQQVFAAARKAGYAQDATLEHIPFGTMNGTDGRPFKTRAGGVMRLESLIQMVRDQARLVVQAAGVGNDYPPEEQHAVADMVALAALKFADLQNNIATDYIFDLEKFSRFEGKTGPYLQYAAVRIKSILRKAEARGVAAGALSIGGKEERDLALQLCLFPHALDRAHVERSPKLICDYLYELAQVFTRFYNECPVLNEEQAQVRESRMAFCEATLPVMLLGLDLLGIPVPERM
jgi:arginyl-tRNA synthetase